MIKPASNRGFTLIETFVAITILLIAILGPMSVIASFLAHNTYAKNQITAAFLAQEGVDAVTDIVKNRTFQRQGELDPTLGWLDPLDPVCLSGNGCDIDVYDNLTISAADVDQYFGLTDDEYYTHAATQIVTPSIFRRQIIITEIPETSSNGQNTISGVKEALVKVRVFWKNKNLTEGSFETQALLLEPEQP